MSLADKVAALRAFFGVHPEVQLLPAVEAMHAAMGSVAEGALPAQVDALVQATGVAVTCNLSLGEEGRHRFLEGLGQKSTHVSQCHGFLMPANNCIRPPGCKTWVLKLIEKLHSQAAPVFCFAVSGAGKF